MPKYPVTIDTNVWRKEVNSQTITKDGFGQISVMINTYKTVFQEYKQWKKNYNTTIADKNQIITKIQLLIKEGFDAEKCLKMSDSAKKQIISLNDNLLKYDDDISKLQMENIVSIPCLKEVLLFHR